METKVWIEAVDTHTEGEPTRILTGGLEQIRLGKGTVAEKRDRFAKTYDWVRKLLMKEPRGHADMFGAVPISPQHEDADIGLFFMDNGGYLNMCGHATIGVVSAFIEMGSLTPKSVINIETPAGLTKARPKIVDGKVKYVAVQNVNSYLHGNTKVTIRAQSGKITVPVDLVHSGNLFGLVNIQNLDTTIDPKNLDKLIDYGLKIREKVNEKQIRNPLSNHLDKVELTEFYRQRKNKPDKNVVIFGDGSVDRSPCGTGTCAKMTLLYNKGKLELNEEYTYEGIIGTRFKGKLLKAEKRKGINIVTPSVAGSAYIIARHTFVQSVNDPITSFNL